MCIAHSDQMQNLEASVKETRSELFKTASEIRTATEALACQLKDLHKSYTAAGSVTQSVSSPQGGHGFFENRRDLLDTRRSQNVTQDDQKSIRKLRKFLRSMYPSASDAWQVIARGARNSELTRAAFIEGTIKALKLSKDSSSNVILNLVDSCWSVVSRRGELGAIRYSDFEDAFVLPPSSKRKHAKTKLN